MKTMLFAAVAAVTMGAGAVEFAECPKCDRWMRISEDGKSATVSLSRLKEAGYRYVNIDDGFFNGHGEDGVLRFHPKRFPRGMKPTVDGIHALGLRAGIYSDAGASVSRRLCPSLRVGSKHDSSA